MKGKLKILFITHYSELYGANRSLLDILVSLKKYPVEPIVLLPETGNLNIKLNELNVRNFTYPFRNPFSYRWKSKNVIFKDFNNIKFFLIGLRDSVLNRLTVRRITRNTELKNVNLIFSNSAVMTIGEDLSRMLKIPHIHQIRELPKQQFSLYPNLGNKWYFNKIHDSQLLIFNSKYNRDNFKHFPITARNIVVYNEIAPPTIKDKIFLPENNFKLGIFGYLSSQKNQIEAIEALSLINQDVNVKLYIIGGGSSCSHINHAESLGVRERIEFTGYTDNVGGYLEKLDVVLVCANNEALGRATIEAMLFGKCVIGKRSGATPELINHNQNGLLYDTVAELARYIDLLYRNPALMNKIAAKAQRSAVTNFSSGKSIRNIYNEFVRLIE